MPSVYRTIKPLPPLQGEAYNISEIIELNYRKSHIKTNPITHPLPSGQLLDPQFVMNLPQLKAFNRHHHSNLGNYFQASEEPEEPEQQRYNLRSQTMVGDFSLLEEETGPTFQGQPISVTVIENFEPTQVANKKSILKTNERNISHSTMMETLLQNISGDQLPAAMAGLQFHVDLSSDEEDKQVSIHRYQYLKLLEQYKQGQLQCNLSNKSDSQ